MKLASSFPLFLVVSASLPVLAQTHGARNGEWTSYRNANYNFSIQYPADSWTKDEGFDKNGVELGPRNTDQFHLSPEIGISGAVGQPSEADDTRPQSLDEDFQVGLNALGKYDHARNVVVLSKRDANIQGLRAIVSTTRYEDSANGQTWFDKQVLIHSDDDSPTYRLSLHCSPDDAAVLVPLFDRILNTFRILGPPA